MYCECVRVPAWIPASWWISQTVEAATFTPEYQ